MTAAWTRKGGGKLYRYYVHTRENKEHAGASGLPRVPAIQLEANVVEQLRLVLRAPDLKSRVAKMMMQVNAGVDEAKVCVAMLQIDKVWDQLFPAEQERIVRLLIKKVVFTPHNLELQLRPNGLERLAAELKLPTPAANAKEVVA
jgi:hypothetical protein